MRNRAAAERESIAARASASCAGSVVVAVVTAGVDVPGIDESRTREHALGRAL